MLNSKKGGYTKSFGVNKNDRPLKLKISMSSDRLYSIANLLLPEVLVYHFELTKHENKREEMHFYFTELIAFQKNLRLVSVTQKASFPKLLFEIYLYVERIFFCTSPDVGGELKLRER